MTQAQQLPPAHELARWSADELREEMQSLHTAQRAMIEKAKAEKREFTAEEDAEYEKRGKDFTALEAALKECEGRRTRSLDARAALLDDSGAALVPGASRAPGRVERAFRGIDQRTGQEVRALLPHERLVDRLNLSKEERQLSVGRYLRGLITGNWTGAEAERRAMTVGDFTAGGALVPAPLAAQVIDLARARSVVVRLGAQTIPMTATTLDLVAISGDPTATWYGEEVRAAGLTESDTSFKRLQLSAHTLAILERASVELAEDAPNFAIMLEGVLAAAIGLALDQAVLYGITAQGWSGLRGDPDPWGLNEISMGTNGAAITDFSKFVEALQKILEGNYPGEFDQLGLAMAPRTWGTIEGFVSTADAQPLRPPASYEKLQKVVSTQIPITETQGSASDASSVFVGAFSQVVIGMRTNITLEASRQAEDAFKRLHVLFRGYLRADWSVLQSKWFTRIIGIVP
jgi:HK97 family phage major capsid protein